MTAANNYARPKNGAGKSGSSFHSDKDSEELRQEEIFERQFLIALNKPLLCGCYSNEIVCTEHTKEIKKFVRECREQINRLCPSEHWRWSW